ncbi:MAG: hypothetical protein ACKOOL_11960 [Novosphingobium sp.]
MSKPTDPPPTPPASGRVLRQGQDSRNTSDASRALIAKSPRPSRRTSRAAFTADPPADDDPLLGFAPYLHPCPRGNSITPERQRAFVAALAASGIVTQAARAIGASLEALYRLRGRPGAEGFAAAWDAAIERGLTRLEDCALERALQGTPTPIVAGGEVVGWWGKPDNHLLRFLLQQRLPAKYGAKAIQPGHPVWEAVRGAVLADPATMARERNLREALAAAQREAKHYERAEAELMSEVERLERELEVARSDVARLERILAD